MNENVLNEILTSKFGKNKYFLEIIKNFIEEYSNYVSRINVNDDEIILKASDMAGSRDISFSIEDGNLKIKINRNVDLKRYQDIITYEDSGIMIERSKCAATLKKDIKDNFNDKPEILISEFNNLGQNPSIYTGKIFDDLDLKIIKRPENFGIEGTYIHRSEKYNEKGIRKGTETEGTFNVLESNSLFVLEFPSEDTVKISNVENLNDENIYLYPNSRSL